jgi:hypothetical protein
MKKIFISLIVLSIASFAGFGNYGFMATKFTSQAGVGVANPSRIYSAGLNPAGTIALNDSSFFQFNLVFPNVGVGFNNSAFSGSDFEQYFNAENGSSKILSEQEEDDFISLLDNNAELLFQTRVNILSLGILISPTIGAFTLSIDDNISLRTKLPQDLVTLAFKGNELGREYIFDDFSYQASYLRSISLNYARNIISSSEEGYFKNLNIGAAVKSVSAFGYSEFVTNRARLFTDENAKISIDVDGESKSGAGQEIYDLVNDNSNSLETPIPEAGGSGIGFDLGAVGELQNGIQLGFSITDIGKVTMNNNVEINNHSLVNIIEEITDDEIDSLETGLFKTASSDSEFDVSLPTTLRFGLTIPVQKFIPLPGLFTASVDYHQGFNNNFANSTTPRIAVGAEWLPFESLPSIMAGIGNDRFNELRVAFGLGYSIKVFDVYIGTRDFISTISGGNRASFSLNFRWKIW